ncbi:MAG TPA: hypothetical protein VMF90_17635 [Rhizobiaceae bacterium]|nr:hypothetical protein [Rhizobiaceae bacterium]
MRLPLAFALGLAFVASAAAQGMAPMAGTFFVKDKGWTIWSGPRGCDAVNRDLTEFNVAPVNALWLTRYAGQGPQTVLRVFYWPGAFEPEQSVTLKFNLLSGKNFEMTGMTTDTYIVDSDHELTEKNITALEEAGYANILLQGKPTLAFVTRGILDAAQYLVRCTATVNRQQ